MSKGMQRSYVNAGGLFFFSERVPPAFEDDTLAGNLAFQLGASSRHNKFSDTAPWRHAYMNAMTTFGSITLRRDERILPVEEQVSVWDLVKQSLNGRVSPVLIQRAEETLICLQTSDAEGFEFFRERSTQCLTVDQSVGPVDEVKSAVALQLAFVDSEPLMTQVFISFKTTSQITGLPFVQLIEQGHIVDNLELALVTTELDEHHYARSRLGILKKLGSLRQELVFKLGGDGP